MTDPTRPAQVEATSTEEERQPDRTGRSALIARLEANWARGDDAANDDLVAEYCADARRRQRALRELPADARPATPGRDDLVGERPPEDAGSSSSEPGSS